MNFHDEKINEESQKYENDWSIRVACCSFLGAMLGAIMGAVSWAVIDAKFGRGNLLLGTDNNFFFMGIAGFIYLGFIGIILGIIISAFNTNLVKSMLIGLGLAVLVALPGFITVSGSLVKLDKLNDLNKWIFINSLFVTGLNGILLSISLDLFFGRKQEINLEEKRTNRLTRRR